MSKLLAAIHRLRKDLDADWSAELDNFNIADDIAVLYDSGFPVRDKNLLLAYIVLAYDNESEWMEVHKDRYQTKLKILKRLGADITSEFILDVAKGKSAVVQRVVTWFTLIYQPDYRWDEIRACFDFHSEMMMLAGVHNPDTYSIESFEKDAEGKKQPVTITEDLEADKIMATNTKKAANMKSGMEMRQIGMEKLKDIQRDYVNIDTALHKEGVTRLTETIDIMKWEPFIQQLRTRVND